MTDRPTMRVFYAPKEKTETPAAAHERRLRERVEFLEKLTDDLTSQLSDRTQELLEALDALEAMEDLVIKQAP